MDHPDTFEQFYYFYTFDFYTFKNYTFESVVVSAHALRAFLIFIKKFCSEKFSKLNKLASKNDPKKWRGKNQNMLEIENL